GFVGVEDGVAPDLDVVNRRWLDGCRLLGRERRQSGGEEGNGQGEAAPAGRAEQWSAVHRDQLSDSRRRQSSSAENSMKRVRTSCGVHSRKIHDEDRRTSPA